MDDNSTKPVKIIKKEAKVKKKSGRKKGTVNASTPKRKKLFLQALEKAYGNCTAASKATGITIPLINKWKKDDSKFHDECVRIIEIGVDERVEIAEHKLMEAIIRGERWAVAFILKTIGKNKGYTEKTETEHTVVNKEIKFTFGNDTPDYLKDSE